MNNIKKTILFSGAVIMIGAGFSYLLHFLYPETRESKLIGLVYAFLFCISFWIAHQSASRKLGAFSTFQSWLIRSALYILAAGFAVLAGLAIHSMLFYSETELSGLLIKGLLEGIYYLLTLPFGSYSDPAFVDLQSRRMLTLFFILMVVIAGSGFLFSYVEMRWREMRQNQLLLKAQIKSLQAQIEPHFLFNSLNTIVGLVRKNPQQAEDLLIRLSELLRFKFNATSLDLTTLDHELQFTQNFLHLMQARFGDRLNIIWKDNIIDKDRKIPPLLLQPLIENSLKHGWVDEHTPLTIEIEIKSTVHLTQIVVADNGKGMSAHTRKKNVNPNHALHNITKRLKLLYGQENLMQLNSAPEQGTTVTITIPE